MQPQTAAAISCVASPPRPLLPGEEAQPVCGCPPTRGNREPRPQPPRTKKSTTLPVPRSAATREHMAEPSPARGADSRNTTYHTGSNTSPGPSPQAPTTGDEPPLLSVPAPANTETSARCRPQ